jgi:hypothetical protein
VLREHHGQIAPQSPAERVIDDGEEGVGQDRLHRELARAGAPSHGARGGREEERREQQVADRERQLDRSRRVPGLPLLALEGRDLLVLTGVRARGQRQLVRRPSVVLDLLAPGGHAAPGHHDRYQHREEERERPSLGGGIAHPRIPDRRSASATPPPRSLVASSTSVAARFT